jgi:hypothetical protein
MIYYKERSINSIVFPNTFYRYFSNQIFSFDVSDLEWYESFKLPYNDFLDDLKNWVRQGARKEIYLRIKMIKDFKTRDNFEKVIRSIFELSNFTVESDDHPSKAWFGYDDLFSKLYKSEDITRDYYSGNANGYLDFLISIFSNDKLPYSYTLGFISYVCNDPNHYRSFPIPQNKLIVFNIRYLKKYLSSAKLLDKESWGLFYNCKIIEVAADGRVLYTIPVEAKQAMIDFFKLKGSEYFLQSIAVRPHGDRFYISDNIKAIFQPIDNVINFVDSFDRSPRIDEFKEFFEKCKADNFQSYVKFEFKAVKVQLD